MYQQNNLGLRDSPSRPSWPVMFGESTKLAILLDNIINNKSLPLTSHLDNVTSYFRNFIEGPPLQTETKSHDKSKGQKMVENSHKTTFQKYLYQVPRVRFKGEFYELPETIRSNSSFDLKFQAPNPESTNLTECREIGTLLKHDLVLRNTDKDVELDLSASRPNFDDVSESLIKTKKTPKICKPLKGRCQLKSLGRKNENVTESIQNNLFISRPDEFDKLKKINLKVTEVIRDNLDLQVTEVIRVDNFDNDTFGDQLYDTNKELTIIRSKSVEYLSKNYDLCHSTRLRPLLNHIQYGGSEFQNTINAEILSEVLKSFDITHKIKRYQTKENRMNSNEIFCKNLFLKDRKGAFYYVICDEEKDIDLKKLTKILGANRNLSFACPKDTNDILHTERGAVTPFALMYGSTCEVRVVITTDMLLENDKLFNFHPFSPKLTLAVTLDDLEKYLSVFNHSLEYVPI